MAGDAVDAVHVLVRGGDVSPPPPLSTARARERERERERVIAG